jgi:BolA protein
MNLNQKRINSFETDLRSSFAIAQLTIEDESNLHAGHAGAASGGGHFRLTIVTPDFQGLNKVARHRAVYAALSQYFPHDIHALTINALTPGEIHP